MAGLDPAIHVFRRCCCQEVDARLEAGHDGVRCDALFHGLSFESDSNDNSSEDHSSAIRNMIVT
jgi:hypothetical protein